tara:strand:+ start:388 stop:861 length:474 start_codon:yes stop_codon:yes gene_type:complete
MEEIKRLPKEVQLKIESYTRMPQTRELMLDVRSFTSDFGMVEDCYFMHYNDRILLYDLLEFCKKKVIKNHIREIAITKKMDPEMYVNYLQYIMVDYDHVSVTQPSIIHVPNNLNVDKIEKYRNREVRRRIRELWGLFSPIIRTKFINDYILMDELEL